MRGSLDQPPIVLRTSRARAVGLVAVSAIFISIGVFLWAPTDSSATRIFCIGFFGLCGLVGVGMLIAPPRLEIGPSGLTQTALWRTSRFAWTDVYNFRPAVIGLTTKVVGFDYLNPPPKRAALRGLNTALTGVQGALQPGWDIAPQELAELLNGARERWLAVSEGAPHAAPMSASRPSLLAGLGGARVGRKAYWLATGVVFAVAIALAYVPGLQRGLGSLTTIIFIRLFAARLHDFGRSGWWQLVLYAVQVPAMVLVGTAGGQPISVIVGVGLLTQLIFTVVLGAIPGDPNTNRFGDPPSQPSPAATSEAFR